MAQLSEEVIICRLQKQDRTDLKALVRKVVWVDGKLWKTDSDFVRSAVIKQIREYSNYLTRKQRKRWG